MVLHNLCIIDEKFDRKNEKKELYNEKLVELYAGQAVLFQNSLMHRGDLNVSKKKVRYAIACFYHDVKLLNNYKNS